MDELDFGYLNCFSNSGPIPFYLDLGPVPLEMLSHPLSVHMQNIQIQFGMHPIYQFEAEVVLDFELDSKSNSRIWNWIGSPPCAHLLASPAPS
jgi:hypothetical protein